MSKRVWVTLLQQDEKLQQSLLKAVAKYNLPLDGHIWIDDLDQLAWLGPKADLLDPNTGLWLVVGSAEDFGKDSLRYGLSLLAIQIQAEKGHGFPIVLAVSTGKILSENLPQPLKSAQISTVENVGVTVAAKVNLKPKIISGDYRLNVHGLPALRSQWFEVGPGAGQTWNGAIFAVDSGEIAFQAVGPAGQLPQKANLEAPVKDIELEFAGRDFTAWGLGNVIDDKSSYYIQVRGYPSQVLFGPSSEEGNAEMYTISLK